MSNHSGRPVTRVLPGGVEETRGFHIASSDGARIFYRFSRPPVAGHPALILLDGIGCDGFIWKYVWPAFRTEFPILHVHYRGHGRTPEPASLDSLSISALAADIGEILRSENLTRCALVGHSMGVQVALELHRTQTERIGALALVCGAPATLLRTLHHHDYGEAILPWACAVADRAPALLQKLGATLLPSQLSYEIARYMEIDPERLRQSDFMPYLRSLARISPVLFLRLLSSAARYSAWDRLNSIRVPTLIVAGERDRFTPPQVSRAMAAAVAHAEFVLLERASHAAPLEAPNEFTDHLRSWLAHAFS